MSAAETLLSVAQAGARVETLRALRDRLSREIDEAPPARDLAALSLRLMDVLEQIDELVAKEPTPKGTALDEFTKRRVDRQSSPRASGSKVGGQRRR